jgi:uncharacterized protein YcaQ
MAVIRTITPDTARRLAITCQGLEGKGFRDKARPGTAANKHDIMNTFRALGCVQIDPIRAVERSQLLVLWSRLGQLDLTQLDKLMWEERQLFEYWAHAASIVMTEDFPIYWRRMRDWAARDGSWNKRAIKWVEENQELQEYILTELEENGPLPSKAFHDKSNARWQSGGWTNGQTSRLMLEYLWEQGHILVSHRKGLTKYWDLRERCLPEWTPRDDLSWEETVFRAAQKSLLALGVARPAHIKNHFTRGNYPELDKALNQFVKEGLVEQVQIVDESEIWPGVWYIHRDRIPFLNRIEQGIWEPRTALLSPFDNLICHRERTEELFDFHFRIEIYVPKVKRQYGYYVLPILYRDKLIGRIDPKMDRKKNQLIVNAIYAEVDAPVTRSSGLAVANVIEDLAGFLGAEEIEMGGIIPEGWRSALTF